MAGVSKAILMNELLARVQENIELEKLFAVATVVSENGASQAVGAKMIVYPDGKTEGTFGPGPVTGEIVQEAQRLLTLETSETREFGERQVFIEVFAPPPMLIIVGGVHTAIPLSRLAKLLGMRVIVVDGRGRFATRERFPDADRIIVEWPDDALPNLPINSSTYVVVLTHDPKFDIPTLAALSKMRPRYVGAMGSRETRKQHFAELRAQGVPDEFLQTVYGPIGLDLGARSPEEMAVAIMGEIIAVRYQHSGGHLKNGA